MKLFFRKVVFWLPIIVLVSCGGKIKINGLEFSVGETPKLALNSISQSSLNPELKISEISKNDKVILLEDADSLCQGGRSVLEFTSSSDNVIFEFSNYGFKNNSKKLKAKVISPENKIYCSNELEVKYNINLDFKEFVSGFNHVCGITKLNQIKCWGNNSNGQLGDGTTISKSLPTLVPNLDNVKKIALGDRHTCALLNSGLVKCWGNNSNGQLGDGSANQSLVPIDVLSLNNVVSISSKMNHTCAVFGTTVTEQKLKCWGQNSNGQLGDSTNADKNVPTEVLNLTNVNDVNAGFFHTCAILNDKSLYCFGNNGFGQLGDGTSVSKNIPANVSSISDVIQVSIGAYHTCARLVDNSVKCWGYNTYGQLGDGTTVSSSLPKLIPNFTNVSNISSGQHHTCALVGNDSSSSLKCWGINGNFQLGDSIKWQKIEPTTVNGISDIKSVSVGAYHSCAMLNTGAIRCWGYNGFGQFGDGLTTNLKVPLNSLASLSTNVLHLESGDRHTCALLKDKSVKCWGSNWHGQLGTGDYAAGPIPSKVLNLENAISISSGPGETTCAVVVVAGANKVKCWGMNDAGQVGDGTQINRTEATYVSDLDNALKVAVGFNFACAIFDLNGINKVKCWGNNSNGQLGDGTTTNHLTPVEVSNLEEVESIYAGYMHACALLNDKTVKCWGYNGYGQLGDATNSTKLIPTLVSNLSDVTSLTVGYYHTCSVLLDKTIKCWGNNGNGQLGDGTVVSKNIPTIINNLDNVLGVKAGNGHTCANLNNGNVKCWGLNTNYQLGDQTNINRSEPTLVNGITNVIKLSLKNANTCALFEDGSVKCWGANAGYQSGFFTESISTVMNY